MAPGQRRKRHYEEPKAPIGATSISQPPGIPSTLILTVTQAAKAKTEGAGPRARRAAFSSPAWGSARR